jgi:hypothetical protein
VLTSSTSSTLAARPDAARLCFKEEGRPSRPLLNAHEHEQRSRRAAVVHWVRRGPGVIASRAGTAELAARAAPALRHAANGQNSALASVACDGWGGRTPRSPAIFH